MTLAELRQAQNLSQARIASLLGLHASTYDRWERGLKQVPEHHRARLAGLLGVDVEALGSSRRYRQPDSPVLLPQPYVPPTEAQVRQERLLEAGMTSERGLSLWALSCLLCARGTGADGVLAWIQRVPGNRPPCRWCGGYLLVEELRVYTGIENLHVSAYWGRAA